MVAGARIAASIGSAMGLATLIGCGSPDRAVETREFLAGPGAPLLAMHAAALEQARGALISQACRARASALQGRLGGEQALMLSTQIPDQELAGAFAVERAALGSSLSVCISGGPDASELAEASSAVEERLDDLEVRR